MISYHILIDQADDGDGESISVWVLSAEWQIGVDEWQAVTSTSRAEIVIWNGAELPSLVAGKRLRIISDDGIAERVHFTGTLDSTELIDPHHVRLVAYGWEHELHHNTITLPTRATTTAGELISDVVHLAQLRHAILAGMCFIDEDGHNLIDTVYIFPALGLATQFDAGKTQFVLMGNNLAPDGKRLIEQATLSENGRFFVDRQGVAVFHDRHRRYDDAPLMATFNDDMEALVIHTLAPINQVEISITPRTIGASHTLLWSLKQSIFLQPFAVVQMTAQYQVDGQGVGAVAVDYLQSDIHYRANARADGTGEVMTAVLHVHLVHVGNQQATLEIRNASASPIYVILLELRGTPIYDDAPLTIRVGDANQSARYGTRTRRLSPPLLTDTTEAHYMAQTIFLRDSLMGAQVDEIRTSTRSHAQATLGLTLNDQIRVQVSAVVHDGYYRIIGEHHQVNKGGADHQVRWLLERDESVRFFRVNRDSLDGARILLPY